MDLIKQCLTTKYATFSGRACRQEFWLFVLFLFVVAVFFNIALALLGMDTAFSILMAIYLIFILGTLIPTFAVYVRRLHDTDHSAWWLLVGFIPLIGVVVLLYFFVSKGTAGDNQFGSDPLFDA